MFPFLLRRPASVLTSAVLAGFAFSTAAQPSAGTPGREVSKLYADYCATCHGANLDAGQVGSLLDDVWKYGDDDASIARAIREGFLLAGMPGWKNDMSEAEIRAMVVFIREKGAEAKARGQTISKPLLNEVVRSREHAFRMELVAEGLQTPWSVAFLPDGRALLTELPGRLRVIENGKLLSQPVAGTPKVRVEGQGGLMAVAAHPGFATNRWVYLAYSDAVTNAQNQNVGMTAIARGRIREGSWVNEATLFRAPAWTYRPGGVHFGCRLVFDDAGHLFFCIGERGQMQDAQDLSRPNGKVHRIFDDGRIPPDNPFVSSSNAIPSIWSYGHRNPQGLARHPVTGELWETEHGPRGGDELNLVQRGRNYGWPIITYGMNYNGTPLAESTAREGLEQPIVHWTPSIAVCGIACYQGGTFPRWRNNLFVTALAQQELRRLAVVGHEVAQQEVLFKNIGRVRDVAGAPDGSLWVLLNGPDRVVKLVPADN